MNKKTERELQRLVSERMTGLGATDSSAILEVSTFKTPLHVQVEKLEQIPMIEETEQMRWGLLMEPVIANQYMEETGEIIRKVRTVLRHKEFPFVIVHPDYLHRDYVLECKNVAYERDQWGKEDDEVPEQVIIQVQKQMALTGKNLAKVRALFSGFRPKTYTIPRNEKLIRIIIEADVEFWRKHIEQQIPVSPDYDHPQTLPLLHRLYNKIDGSAIDLGDEIAEVATKYQLIASDHTAIGKQKDALKAELIATMGEAALGYLPDGRYVTRKEISKAPYQVNAHSYIDLRIHKPVQTKIRRQA